MPRFLHTTLLGLLVALSASAPALASTRVGPTTLHAQLSATMAAAGRSSGAYVYDLSEQRALFAVRPDGSRPPASVQKLYTSATVLERLGAQGRLSTSLLGVGQLSPDGVWHGDLYLRGGGDPTFGSDAFLSSYYGRGQGAPVSALVTQLLAQGVSEIDGRVLGDESLFDSLRGGPTSAFAADSQVEGVLSGLAYNRGASGAQQGPHAPASFAASMLVRALKQAGVSVLGGVGAAVAPSAAVPLAQVRSAPVSTLLRLMDVPSDNYLAEMLLKDMGAYFGAGGSTAAGAAVVRQTIAALGIHIKAVDGSGLSRADRTSPHQLVTLLSKLSATALGGVLRGAVAVAGRSGTLLHRMRGTAADNRCQAKTGTLDYVSNLAGWCQAAGGHTLLFALLMDGIPASTAHALQDRMAASIARYDDGVAVLGPPSPGGAAGPTGPTGATGAAGSSRAASGSSRQ